MHDRTIRRPRASGSGWAMLCRMRAEEVAMRSLRVLDAVMASRVASSWCCGSWGRG